MKPKTKLQQQVVGLSKSLPPLSAEQKAWALKHCLNHVGYRTKAHGISCLDCGHVWKEDGAKVICPKCGAVLKVEDTQKRLRNQRDYFGIITICGGFQVLRFFMVSATGIVAKPMQSSINEVVQHWISPNGKFTTVALLRKQSFLYCDLWNYSSQLEVRPYYNHAHDILPAGIYPKKKLLPEIKRNGFKGNYHGLTPLTMFTHLLSDSKFETLLKAGQYALLKNYSVLAVSRYWDSIKICIRNGYTIPDFSTWADYVCLLKHFGKDHLSTKYVCPENLNKEHDRYLAKRREQERREEAERKQKEIAKAEKIFKKLKAKFFGIAFSGGGIQVKTLDSVKEYFEEGQLLNHCVFLSDYHLKPDTLVLSARVDGKPVETVEVSLKSFEVVQCRGLHNKNTKYHRQILKLVKQNIGLIRKAA